MEPKRTELSKQNCVKGWVNVNDKQKIQGLGNKNVLSFPEHDPPNY